MKITKYGHSCMLIEDGGARILIDPGAWSSGEQNNLVGLDVILITHEHRDHLDPESIQRILGNNPQAKVYSNQAVGKILIQNQIQFNLLKNGQSMQIKGVFIEAFGEQHALIHPSIPIVEDTGYLIAGKFFYPGDAFHIPSYPPEILALTTYAPWATFSEMMDYAQRVKPKICIAVHDAVLKTSGQFWSPVHQLAPVILKESGIEFRILEEGKPYDFA